MLPAIGIYYAKQKIEDIVPGIAIGAAVGGLAGTYREDSMKERMVWIALGALAGYQVQKLMRLLPSNGA